jgi:hypothetical protein
MEIYVVPYNNTNKQENCGLELRRLEQTKVSMSLTLSLLMSYIQWGLGLRT